jgi:hypothetical protein
MSNDLPLWDIKHLQTHLQYAVDLEFWTIPFYMSAMYSIKDPSHEAYRLIQSVVYQEMLHVELAGNIANAYGLCPTFDPPPKYEGQDIPHLCFDLDTPDPRDTFHPYSAEIGPLDEKRINAMCLIEFPEWETGHQPDLREETEDYGSIGEFYDAVRVGASELVDDLKGGLNQVNFFQNFYRGFDQQTITLDGAAGFKQAMNLINAITDQGEGQTEGKMDIPPEFQNTADGFHPDWTHFQKFVAIRDSTSLPETYEIKDKLDRQGEKAQQILIDNFTAFRCTLEKLFRGEDPGDFASQMATLGGNILTCWQRGAVPRFSRDK